MIEKLHFKDVGPASELSIPFKSRMNFLTGDNGLGKSFILDAAWWALTRTWARAMIRPHPAPAVGAIAFAYRAQNDEAFAFQSRYDRAAEIWASPAQRSILPGLVIYAQVEGGFSVWDPARNDGQNAGAERPDSYLFSKAEIWQGNAHCEGLIRDWASWQREQGVEFGLLKKALRTLSPSDGECIEPGPLRRISLDDPKHYPTLKMPYGQDVPVTQASAGIQRIIALAYVMVWAWRQHLEATELRGETPTQEILFLVDELEAHLHPQWQRRIVPSLLEVMASLTGAHDVQVQLIAATHSPLVLASTESRFDPHQDAIWELDLKEGRVQLTESPWQRRGDASAWLTSSVFDLKEARSEEAEQAITDALALYQLGEAAEMASIRAVDDALRRALSGIDPFWIRWSAFTEARGGIS